MREHLIDMVTEEGKRAETEEPDSRGLITGEKYVGFVQTASSLSIIRIQELSGILPRNGVR